MATKSLGTLTLDLVAKIGGFTGPLDKAGRANKKWKAGLVKDLNAVGAASAAAAGLVATSTALMIKSQADSARAIRKLAQVSDAGTQEFQRYAAGAKFVGVEQEKLADIFKDASDRVGDFLQTGGGPLADFFENIAPKIGVTANEFRNLSGPQALELYVSSLEKANLSQSEMVFFMEALSSNSTFLLPLLKNNAAGFKALGDQAQEAGAIMSDDMLSSAGDLNTSLFLLGQSSAGFKNQLGESLLPVIGDAAIAISELSVDSGVAASAGDLLADSMKFLAKAGAGVYSAFNLVGKSIGTVMAAAAAAANFDMDGAKAAFKAGAEDIQAEALKSAEFMSKIDALGSESGGPGGGRIAALKKYLEESEKVARKDADIAKKSFDANKKISESIEAFAMQEAALGKTATETELYKLELLGATDAQLALAKSSLDAVAAFDAQVKAQEEASNRISEINSQAESIRESLLSEEEAIQESYERRRDIILENTKFTGEAQNNLLRELDAQRLEDLKAIEDEKSETIRAGYSALLDVVGSYYDGMEGKQAAYARVAISIGQMLLDEEKREAVQKIVARTHSAAMGAYESLSSIPYVGPALGAAAAGAIYVAGAASGAKVLGLAHDGIDAIPETGTWILEKGERVTTASTSAKLDRTLDDIQESRGGSMQANGISVVNNVKIIGGEKDATVTSTGRQVSETKFVQDIVIDMMVRPNSPGRRGMAGNSNLVNRGSM